MASKSLYIYECYYKKECRKKKEKSAHTHAKIKKNVLVISFQQLTYLKCAVRSVSPQRILEMRQAIGNQCFWEMKAVWLQHGEGLIHCLLLRWLALYWVSWCTHNLSKLSLHFIWEKSKSTECASIDMATTFVAVVTAPKTNFKLALILANY